MVMTMSDTAIWDRNRGVIRSNIGGWVVGKGVMNRGFEMLGDFVGKLSYMQVMVFNITGRIPERRLADWMEATHICLSWPDPRIWCNHIGALGGSARASALASIAAGCIASDGRAYGTKTIIPGMGFIQRAKLEYETGLSVHEIIKNESARYGGKPLIMGYARPIAKGDERVPALDRFRKELGFPIGEHLALAFSIDEYLEATYSETININGYMSAFFSDQGFAAEEIYQIIAMAVSSGVAACYADTRNKPAESFFPLRCDDIEYEGVACRTVPEAERNW